MAGLLKTLIKIGNQNAKIEARRIREEERARKSAEREQKALSERASERPKKIRGGYAKTSGIISN
jgi:hypothetical protein